MTEHDAHELTNDELDEMLNRGLEYHTYASVYHPSQLDAVRLVAALRAARVENAKFKHDVMAIAEREVQRAEAMGGKPEEYPKQYVDGRYRTAIEILGQFRMMFVVVDPTLRYMAYDKPAESHWPSVADIKQKSVPAFRVGQRVRLKTERGESPVMFVHGLFTIDGMLSLSASTDPSPYGVSAAMSGPVDHFEAVTAPPAFKVGQRVRVKRSAVGKYPPNDKLGVIEAISRDMYGTPIVTVQCDDGMNGGGLHFDEIEAVD